MSYWIFGGDGKFIKKIKGAFSYEEVVREANKLGAYVIVIMLDDEPLAYVDIS